MYYVKTCPRSVDDVIAVGRLWPGSVSGGAVGGAGGGAVDPGEGLLGAAVGCVAGGAAGRPGDAGSRTPGLSGWFTTSADRRPPPVVTSS